MNENPIFTEEDEKIERTVQDMPELTKKETRRVIAGALLAGLLIAAVFIVACLLFLLFCVYVWFR